MASTQAFATHKKIEGNTKVSKGFEIQDEETSAKNVEQAGIQCTQIVFLTFYWSSLGDENSADRQKVPTDLDFRNTSQVISRGR